MTDLVTGNQIDIAAFDSGMSNPYKEDSLRYKIKEQTSRLPRFLNKQYQRIPEDVRDFGEGMANVVVQGAFGEGGLLRSEMNPLGLQPVDALKAVDAVTTGVSNVTGIDKGFLEAVELAVPFVPKGGKIVSKVKGRLIDEATDFAFRNAPEGSVARMVYDTGGGIAPVTRTNKAYLKWVDEGDAWYKKNFDKPNPMEGFRRFTDPVDGKVYRRTTGGRIKGTDRRNLINLDVEKKGKSVGARTVTEEKWQGELKKSLEQRGMLDRYDEFAKEIKQANKKQDSRRTALNKMRQDKLGITQSERQFTIQHSGALKEGWPNTPDNRWGLQERRFNSAEGSLSDPPSQNIRYSGTSADMEEWVRKKLLQEEGLDITSNLPVKTRRQIRQAFTRNKKTGVKTPNIEKINAIYEDYFNNQILDVKAFETGTTLGR